MSQALRELRRAPARIIASVFALALAVGAIGVLAVPTVSTTSLRAAAERDGIPEIVIRSDDTGSFDVEAELGALGNVDRVEAQVLTTAELLAVNGEPVDGTLDVLGAEIGAQEIDVVSARLGRLPIGEDEAVVAEGRFAIGDVLTLAGPSGSDVDVDVVGIGGTSFYDGSDIVFTGAETAARLEGIDGANRLVVRAVDDGKAALRSTAGELRDVLADDGIATRTLPFTIPGGRHPIEADIDQVSTLVGLLGIVAGLVALVLLGSTTNTLIAERTREVAVMRALGAPDREMRRRLRRIALAIALASVLIGIPLGIAISNFIARMVLDEFIGMTPGFAVSVPVVVGSALFALIGARLVAARAARRVTKRPLAEALRDRDGSPFGRRMSERMAARVPLGGLLDRNAVRNGLHRRARSLAMFAQVVAAVAALMVVTSLATTVNDFNAAERAPWRWQTATYVPGPGLDIDASIADGDPNAEVIGEIDGELAGWEIDVRGFEPATQMIDRALSSGRWFAADGEAIVSDGFAGRIGVDVGDEIDVEIATGRHAYTVVGLHPERGRSVMIDLAELGEDMNRPGMANVLMSTTSPSSTTIDGPTSVYRASDLEEDDSGRQAILLIFGAIGAIVVSVAGLAVASGLAVNVFERRHEFAALRAIGGRRRHVFRVVVAELLPLAVAGIGAGLVAGYVGAAAIIESFEASNAVEIGFTFATGSIPAAAAVVLVGCLVLGGLMVRRVTHRPVAVTLRGAA